MNAQAQHTARQVVVEDGIDYVCFIASGIRSLHRMSTKDLEEFKRTLVEDARQLSTKIDLFIGSNE